jgi:hypothetical protein
MRDRIIASVEQKQARSCGNICIGGAILHRRTHRISQNSCGADFLTADRSFKECIMFGRQYLLTTQLVIATALALGVSGIALADDSTMNPFTGESFVYFNGGQNRGNPNVLAQNTHPQVAVAAGPRQKKDEQTIESKTMLANRETPITSPSTYAGADYSALLSRLIFSVKSVGL